MSGKLRKIAVEEAFSIPEIADLLIDIGKSPTLSLDKTFFDPVFRQGLRLHKRPVREDLLDVETHRLAEMDRLGVDMQILSLSSPGVQMFDADTACELSALANDRLADIVRRRPDRFGGLACCACHPNKELACGPRPELRHVRHLLIRERLAEQSFPFEERQPRLQHVFVEYCWSGMAPGISFRKLFTPCAGGISAISFARRVSAT